MSEPERTWCPSCGALTAPDAEWCGQCYRSLRTEAPRATATADLVDPAPPEREIPKVPLSAALLPGGEPVPSVSKNGNGTKEAGKAPAPPEALARRPTWPCAVCETENDLELDRCAGCGAPFARLFDEPEAAPRVDPRKAVVRSLIFPGLGQAAVGNAADGVARAVLFLWAFGAGVLLVSSGGPASSSMRPVGILFIVVALLLYALSAMDAYRVSSRGAPLLSPRVMLYGTIGLIVLSVGSLFLLVTRALGGGGG